jgi:hypothetical protein
LPKPGAVITFPALWNNEDKEDCEEGVFQDGEFLTDLFLVPVWLKIFSLLQNEGVTND